MRSNRKKSGRSKFKLHITHHSRPNSFGCVCAQIHGVSLSTLPSFIIDTPKNMNTYGPCINLENSKKAVALALAEARNNNWTMAAAIVDGGGNLVYFEKMDNTQIGSVNIAIEKARSSALFKRPTKAFEDALASGGGGLVVLGVPGVFPLEGGVPLVGAIGISGETSQQDGQCAKAGADAFK
jgi:glc operon protein GlcG